MVTNIIKYDYSSPRHPAGVPVACSDPACPQLKLIHVHVKLCSLICGSRHNINWLSMIESLTRHPFSDLAFEFSVGFYLDSLRMKYTSARYQLMSPPHYEKDETTHNTHHVRPGVSEFSMLQHPILLSDWLDLAVFCLLTSACNNN